MAKSKQSKGRSSSAKSSKAKKDLNGQGSEKDLVSKGEKKNLKKEVPDGEHLKTPEKEVKEVDVKEAKEVAPKEKKGFDVIRSVKNAKAASVFFFDNSLNLTIEFNVLLNMLSEEYNIDHRNVSVEEGYKGMSSITYKTLKNFGNEKLRSQFEDDFDALKEKLPKKFEYQITRIKSTI